MFSKTPPPQPPKLWSQRSFDIFPGVNLTEPLGFYPLAVIVDNYSGYWLQIPDAGRYVAPYTTGAILPLIHAVQAYANWDFSPYGPQAITATSAQIAHLTYTDDPNLTYGGGTSIGTQPLLIYNSSLYQTGIVGASTSIINSWAATAIKPSFVGGYLTGTVRGTSPGAAEAWLEMYVRDSFSGNKYSLSGLIIDESSPTRAEWRNPTPIQPINLNPTEVWAVYVDTTTILGTPTIDYGYGVSWI